MDHWNYKCSIYNEHVKMWMFFKTSAEIIKSQIDTINNFIGWDYLKFKNGFMDFQDKSHIRILPCN